MTNQPDVSRGTQRRENVDAINREIQVRLALDDFRVCYHDDADRCECRKPKPGLILDSARGLALDPARSPRIGDRWSDIEAVPDAQVRTLAAAATWILGQKMEQV